MNYSENFLLCFLPLGKITEKNRKMTRLKFLPRLNSDLMSALLLPANGPTEQ